MADFDVRVRDLAAGTRALILSVVLDVVEVARPGQRVIGYGLDPLKLSEDFCHVAELLDPESLLRGPGKLMCHMRENAPEDLANPGPRRLLEVANTHRMPAKSSSRKD